MAYSTSLACITLETLFFFGVIILDVVIYYMIFLKVEGIKPFQRGFFCNDQDIMKPYKTERLSFVGLLTAGTILSLASILVIELELYFERRNGNAEDEEEKDDRTITIPSGVIRMLHRMGIFGCGMAILVLICQLITIMTGRLRPHFLAVCQPNTTLYNCSDGYITADVCTGDPLKVKHARLSFPAMHTAASTYSLVFVAICFHCLNCLRNNKILRTTVQGALILLAIATGMSRISRYYHHWGDVVGGLVLGAVAARIVAVNIMRLTTKKNKRPVYMSVPDQDGHYDNGSEKKQLLK